MTLLSVQDLDVSFTTEAGKVRVLDSVSFDLEAGQTLGLVGESGCGKSVTALSIMRLLPKPSGIIDGGSVLYKGQNLLSQPADAMHAIRGNRIAMIFQDPMTALNPVHRIGKQLCEVYQLHFPELDKQQQQQKAIEMLQKVGIPAAEERFFSYPHQLSGGMRQRVMIAMALACEPDILIADEPTTALDVTIQAQILDLMQELQRENGMAIIFITHDLGVIAELCDQVVVMYAGRVAEKSSVIDLFQKPVHPYTQGLLASIPRLDGTPKSTLHTIPGSVPSLSQMINGCRFSNRCPHRADHCEHNNPIMEPVHNTHTVACLRWRELSR